MGWCFGGVGGVRRSHGNVWVFHRPHTLEKPKRPRERLQAGAARGRVRREGQLHSRLGGPSPDGGTNGPTAAALLRLRGVSLLLERAADHGDGRPGSGEHGIFVDHKDNVWLTGNGDGDGQILKFTKEGKFCFR